MSANEMPERHADTDRNKIINHASSDLEKIINGHDPEIHHLGNRIWDRLDKMAMDIENRRSDLCASGQVRALVEALRIAEAALSDIGDAEREEGDDLAWCEARAAKALPVVRPVLKAALSTRPAPAPTPTTPTAQEAVPVADLPITPPTREQAAGCQVGQAGPRRWVVIYYDQDVRPEHFDDETAARHWFAQTSRNYNCRLYAEVMAAPPSVSVAEALELAAARLQRLALEIPSTTSLRADAFEWADEALRALKGSDE